MKHLYSYDLTLHKCTYYFTVADESSYYHLKPLNESSVCLSLDEPLTDLSTVYLKDETLKFREAPLDYFYYWNNDSEEWFADLSQLKEKQSKLISKACTSAIFKGFESDALGAFHHYPAGEKDQLNMIASVIDSLNPSNNESYLTPFWCADSEGVWDYRLHTKSQIQKAGSDGKAHIVAQISKNAQLQAQIQATINEEELNSIVW